MRVSIVYLFVTLVSAGFASADNTSDMERLFGKKIAKETGKPTQPANDGQQMSDSERLFGKKFEAKESTDFDATKVTYEGVRLGMSYQEATDILKDAYPDLRTLIKRNPDSDYAVVTALTCGAGGYYPCRGGHKEKTLYDGVLIKETEIQAMFSSGGILNGITYTSRKKVADNERDCNAILEQEINRYVGLLGTPYQEAYGGDWRNKRKKEWWANNDQDVLTWYPACDRNGILDEKVQLRAGTL